MTKVSKFDEVFERWVYKQIIDIPNVDPMKWSHALAYTGGVDINDQNEYEKKLGWVISGSPIITSYMRHQMHLIAEHMGVPVEYRGNPYKLVKPKTFKALGINIVRYLRRMHGELG